MRTILSAVVVFAAVSASAGPQANINDKPPADAVAVMQSFAATALNPALAPWASVTCGPQLWSLWTAKDAALSQKGTAPKAGGRNFQKAAKSDTELYKSASFQAFIKPFTNVSHARLATPPERDKISALLPQPLAADKAASSVEAGGDTLIMYHEKDALWLELAGAPKTAAAPAPAVPAVAAAPTVETIYTGYTLRDPFLRSSAGGVSAKPFSPDDFSIHNLTLRGVMKDKAADYALFLDRNFGMSFILRRGKLYDSKGKTMQGVTGSMNLKQKTAFLKTQESDVQTFKLGEDSKD